MAEVLSSDKPLGRIGQPRHAYIKSLRKMSRKDYNALEAACVRAYLERSYRVTLIVSYMTKFPEDFPRALPNTRVQDGVVDYITVSARSLLQWLNRHGHSTITAESIRQSLVDFTIKTKGLIDELDS